MQGLRRGPDSLGVEGPGTGGPELGGQEVGVGVGVAAGRGLGQH